MKVLSGIYVSLLLHNIRNAKNSFVAFKTAYISHGCVDKMSVFLYIGTWFKSSVVAICCVLEQDTICIASLDSDK